MIRQLTRLPRPSPPDELRELTARELDVLRPIAQGRSNAEIGQELYISEGTIKTHVTHVLQKLNVRDLVQAVVLAYQTGMSRPSARAERGNYGARAAGGAERPRPRPRLGSAGPREQEP